MGRNEVGEEKKTLDKLIQINGMQPGRCSQRRELKITIGEERSSLFVLFCFVLAYLSASAEAILESLGPQSRHIEDHKDNRGQADEVEESFGPGKGVVCPNLLFGWLIVATVF